MQKTEGALREVPVNKAIRHCGLEGTAVIDRCFSGLNLMSDDGYLRPKMKKFSVIKWLKKK